MNAGYFPVKLQALPEGTCIHTHVPVYQVSRSHHGLTVLDQHMRDCDGAVHELQ